MRPVAERLVGQHLGFRQLGCDPVCDLSPHHHVVTEAVTRARDAAVQTKPIVFRDDRNSRKLAARALPGS